MHTTTTFTSFGQPEDVVQLTKSSCPDLQPGQVRVRMLAAPINPADINYIQGVYGIKPELPTTPGLEGCGKVIESQSDGFQPGDLIITIQPVGTWAEEIVCNSSCVLKIPHNTPIDQASMLKVNPLTAWCMLTQFTDLPKGSWIIQNAANSGVGTCVIQIARLLGLRTINLVRREEPVKELLRLGANHVLLDNKQSIDTIKQITAEAPPLIALNAVGGDSALRLMNAVTNKGLHITYGAMSRKSLKVPNSILIFKRIQLHGFWLTEWLKETPSHTIKKTYGQLAQWTIEKNLTQIIDSAFPLTQVHQALARANQDKRNGKVLISMRA